jgi:hypothetical protein
MLLKTILNRIAPQKSFVYGKVSLVSKGKQLALEVELTFRTTARDYPGISSGDKSFRWAGYRDRVGRRTPVATHERSDSTAA